MFTKKIYIFGKDPALLQALEAKALRASVNVGYADYDATNYVDLSGDESAVVALVDELNQMHGGLTGDQKEQLKKASIIKTKVYDGMVFSWTTAGILAARSVIGFYFDRLGQPQEVHRESIYGEHLRRWDSEG